MSSPPVSGYQGHVNELQSEGFTELSQAIAVSEVQQLLADFDEANQQSGDGIKSRKGDTYAARNVLKAVPRSRTVWQTPPLLEFLNLTLGPDFGLVRGLFFDKHPERTWSLGWHKDMTIAVNDNSIPTEVFTKPTKKAGVPHVEGSLEVLQNMVTLRIHLDPVTDENGPLEVIPKSHLSGKETTASTESFATIFAEAGDVLAMRPLICHASGSSKPGTEMHRRILHLEFSGSVELADGYQWHDFIRPNAGD